MRSPILACGLLSLAVALAVATPSEAQPSMGASAGLTFSVSLGDRPMFGLGVDARATVLARGCFSRDCSPGPFDRAGLGPFVQATLLDFKAGRFAAGLHGGGEVGFWLFSLDGELGWTYRTSLGEDRPGVHGVHLGLLSPLFPAEELSIRVAVSRRKREIVPEVILGVGARFPSPFGMPWTGGE
jgi:hypothetical protein